MQSSRHHLLFEGTLWNARKETKALRCMGGSIVRLAAEPHRELHRAVSSVLVPNIYMARHMLANYSPQGDVFRNIDELSRVAESATNHYRATEIDKQLGGLIVMSLQLQKPFIREGIHHG